MQLQKNNQKTFNPRPNPENAQVAVSGPAPTRADFCTGTRPLSQMLSPTLKLMYLYSFATYFTLLIYEESNILPCNNGSQKF